MKSAGPAVLMPPWPHPMPRVDYRHQPRRSGPEVEAPLYKHPATTLSFVSPRCPFMAFSFRGPKIQVSPAEVHATFILHWESVFPKWWLQKETLPPAQGLANLRACNHSLCQNSNPQIPKVELRKRISCLHQKDSSWARSTQTSERRLRYTLLRSSL